MLGSSKHGKTVRAWVGPRSVAMATLQRKFTDKMKENSCFMEIKTLNLVHGKKGFVIPTKSFVKIGIAKIFCYNKMFSSINKSFGCCSQIFG